MSTETFNQPSIALLYVGDEHPLFETAGAFDAWVRSFEELALVARVTPECIRTQSSTNSLAYCTEIVQWIQNHQEEYEGFVVFLPRTVFLYTAQLIQLMIRETGKPIVCTTDYAMGFQPQFRSFESMMLKSDVLNAVQIAGSSVAGVMLIAGQEVVSPDLAVVEQTATRPIVRSRSTQIIGRMQFGFVPHPSARVRSQRLVQCDPFSPDVVAFIEDHTKLQSIVASMHERNDIRGYIVSSNVSVPISVVNELPQAVPTLFVSEQGNQIFENGTFVTVPQLPPAVLAGRFTWLRAHMPLLPAPELIDRMVQWHGAAAALDIPNSATV